MDGKRLKALYTIGGARLCMAYVGDRKQKTGRFEQLMYQSCLKADPKRYPDMLAAWYYLYTGKELLWDRIRTYNEKLQWLKIYDSTPLKTRLSDKYLVREWVKETVGERYLIPLLGVWNRFEEIDLDALPERFMLKANHGSRWNLPVKDKSLLEASAVKKLTDTWLDTNYAFCDGFELQYKDISPRLIAEAYLESEDPAGREAGLMDYKFHCFNGEPKLIQVIGERKKGGTQAREMFLDTQWEPNELMCDHFERYAHVPERPENLEEMLALAARFSSGFFYVRVDLYDVDGRIFFGEMTFTPASGIRKWKSDADDLEAGNWIRLDPQIPQP